MPYNCCVPQCSSVSKKESNLMFHKFPRNSAMKKKWLIKIKSAKKPSIYAKVCSKHFCSSQYTTTSLGEWKILNYKTAIPTLHLPIRHLDNVNTNRSDRSQRWSKRNTAEAVKEKEVMDINEFHSTDADVVNEIIIENEQGVTTEEKCISVTCGVQTTISLWHAQIISVTTLNNVQIKHFSGFERHEFECICYFFKNKEKACSTLNFQDEILLTLMKLRHNFYYKTLQMFFDIDHRVVTTIFRFWVHSMYGKLKSVDFWSITRKRSINEYDVIIDCTEFSIERSKDPIIQQATYSQYKGTNTFKALVGCTEYGAVVYVSDLYGGCISDRKITEDSGFLNGLNGGEYVLADRGFDISDLLEVKGIHLNIPPFKYHKSQLSEEEVNKTRAIANRRILIEQINGLAKKHKILVDRMPVHIWNLANQIVYICFMLTSFRETIVRI